MRKLLAAFTAIVFSLAVPLSAIPQCIVPPNGAVVKTASYTAAANDTGKLIVMNCSSACTLTLPSVPQSPVWQIWVSSIGSVAAQISPNGLTLDGSSSAITLSGDLASGIMIMTDNANYFSSRGTPGQSIVTASAAAAAANQVAISAGASRAVSYSDFADEKYFPAAAQLNGTGEVGWTCPNATPAVLLRGGTNNKDALLSPWGATDTCVLKVHIPKDANLSASFDLSLDLTSTDATSGHTIIMQAATQCAKGDGSTTDDVAFNAAQSFATVTLNGNANRTWTTTLTGLTMTGCSAPGWMWIKISRTTDTATNVGVYGATLDIPRRPVVQAQ